MTQTMEQQRFPKGAQVYGLHFTQTPFRGRVLSQRGIEVRIVNDLGVVRTFHASLVFSA